MNGYIGKILVVNLTTGELKDEPLNEQFALDFIGAGGIACRYLADMVNEKTDPLGPGNPLIFMAGLMNGTGGPSLSRWVVAARSPLTTFYGDANCGGSFGSEMRFAGYDGIILKGKSEKPVYLYVNEGKAELKDASGLWGKNTYETIDVICTSHSDERTRVVCIGRAGETGVLYANIMTEDGHCAGRAGLGCVMGSKKLKAIAVRGKVKKIPMADPEKFREASRAAMEGVRESLGTQMMHDAGTCGWVDMGILYGDTPTKYYTMPSLPEATGLSGAVQAQNWQVGTTACFACPIACRKVLHIREGRFATDKPTEGPEYESVAALGPMLMISDMGAINHINTLVNGYGMDSISCGASAGFAFRLYEKGVITKKDTGGLELKWGDIDAAIRLLHLVGKNEGFGRIVAEGTKRMGARYGCPGEAMQVKGLEIPMHDHRAWAGMGLAYATSNRGADHNKPDYFAVDNGVSIPEIGIVPGDRFASDKAQMFVTWQDLRSCGDALGMCHFVGIPYQNLIDMLYAATGRHIEMVEMLQAGERIFQLMRAMTCKLGVTPEDDKLPEFGLRPIQGGGTEGHVPDMDKMLPEYYALRGWDTVTGKPSRERMEALGIGELAGGLGIK